MAYRGKRIRNAYEGIDVNKEYALSEAVQLVKDRVKTKFDETFEVAISLGVDTRKADQNVRGMVSLPNGTGKKVRIAVFAQDAKADDARAAGADVVGSDDLVEQIKKGDLDFDRCIATPDMMPLVAKVGKILGPRGLMPNPKLGTVTADVKDAIETAKKGQIEFRAEKSGIVHAGIGKASFDNNKIIENIDALISALKKAKPEASKGTYLKKLSVSSTMGPGVKVDIGSVN